MRSSGWTCCDASQRAEIAEIAEPGEAMDVFREFHHAVGSATCGEVCCGEVDFTCLSRPVPTFEIHIAGLIE